MSKRDWVVSRDDTGHARTPCEHSIIKHSFYNYENFQHKFISNTSC